MGALQAHRRAVPTFCSVTGGDGVVVECYKDGGKLRMRVISEGYHNDWNVQFPKNLREEGARFVVEEVRESSRGGFYRARGEIRKLEE